MKFFLFTRKGAIAGKISVEESIQKIDSLFVQFDKMFSNPSPNKIWDEISYLSDVSFSEPLVSNLLKIDRFDNVTKDFIEWLGNY